MAQVPPDISGIEAGLVTAFMAAIDGLQFILVIIPLVDLVTFILGWVLWIFGFFALNLYFLLRVSPSYLGGKRTTQKVATTAGTAVAGMLPFLDGFVPELTIEAAAMFWLLRKERQDYAASAHAARA